MANLDRYLKTSEDGHVTKYNTKTKNMVFTEVEEEALAQYVIQCSRMFYGITNKELRRLAFQFAKANEKHCPPSWERDGYAGEDWIMNLQNRRNLSLRNSENTSLARAAAFNPTNVGLFHAAHSSALTRGSFEAANIWNLDETGVSTDKAAACGERQVARLYHQRGARYRGDNVCMYQCRGGPLRLLNRRVG